MSLPLYADLYRMMLAQGPKASTMRWLIGRDALHHLCTEIGVPMTTDRPGVRLHLLGIPCTISADPTECRLVQDEHPGYL